MILMERIIVSLFTQVPKLIRTASTKRPEQPCKFTLESLQCFHLAPNIAFFLPEI